MPGIQAGRQRETNEGRQKRAVPAVRSTNEGRQRQMNPSTQRAVPGIQAGRQWETNEGGERETRELVHPETKRMKGDKGRQNERREPCQTFRTGDNGRQMKGDKGRQMNPSTHRAVPGILGDNGRQMKGDKGRERNPSTERWETMNPSTQRAMAGAQADKRRQMNPSTQTAVGDGIQMKGDKG